MSTLLIATAANNASSVAHSSSPAPAIWMLIMMLAIIPWAAYIYSDHARSCKDGFFWANMAIFFFGVAMFPVAVHIAGS